MFSSLITAFYVGSSTVNGHNNPWGCPQGIAPLANSYCSQNSLRCEYPGLGENYLCSQNSWLLLGPSPAPSPSPPPSQQCYHQGQWFANGFTHWNHDGCNDWTCRSGRIEYNPCPHIPTRRSCHMNGLTYADGFKHTDQNGCVNWECKDGTIQYNPCPVKPHNKQCYKDGFWYADGYVKKTNGCSVWQCSNGKVFYLGGCDHTNKKCYKNGIWYANGFHKHRNDGTIEWVCDNGKVEPWTY